MKLNPVGVIAILGGLVLLYSAVKNKKPQDVIREALGKKGSGVPLAAPTVDTSSDATVVEATLPANPNPGVPTVSV